MQGKILLISFYCFLMLLSCFSQTAKFKRLLGTLQQMYVQITIDLSSRVKLIEKDENNMEVIEKDLKRI